VDSLVRKPIVAEKAYRNRRIGVSPNHDKAESARMAYICLPQDHWLGSVERQVQYGSSGMMRMMVVGEIMPALPYGTEEESAAAYLYLVEYPPQP
jgi:hypothetical protein